MQQVKIQPRILPRDFLDFLISFFIFTFMLILVLIPGIVLVLITKKLIFFIVTNLVIIFFILKYSTVYISISKKGITFHTILGKPRFVDWKEIVRIQKTTTSQFIKEAILTPSTVVRETGTAFTAKGYYKITWKYGYFFFPPKNPKEFVTLVHQNSHIIVK